jgi:hypothetical protein
METSEEQRINMWSCCFCCVKHITSHHITSPDEAGGEVEQCIGAIGPWGLQHRVIALPPHLQHTTTATIIITNIIKSNIHQVE